uniref:Ig-like domain-containing protein n=1 Tax=Xiphophorus maculatus TaxID=8083 RepID=A0A3B5QYF7_XIPMA
LKALNRCLYASGTSSYTLSKAALTLSYTRLSSTVSTSCILPCNVDPSSDTVTLWDHLTSGEHNVHSYYDSEDQLGRQDQQFKGRTSLFKDLISRGNASLKLTGVKIQDEGRYRCYSSTERGSKKTFIQLKVEDTEVTCVHNQSCILPCMFHMDSVSIVHWIHMTDGDPHAHSYNSNENQVNNQNPNFRGRTSLFRDQLSRGDASLLLTGVKVQDEGKYKCYASTNNGRKELNVYLNVEGKICQQVVIYYNRLKLRAAGLLLSFFLRCFNSYPASYGEPILHWTQLESSELRVHSYYDNQDQLGPQNENFRGRTSLFQDQISRGNASLLLREVQLQDQGRYSCYISTIKGHEESIIRLSVDGMSYG